MASTNSSADQSIEFQVFGRTPVADDWLRDIRLRSALMFQAIPQRDLTRLLTTRLIKRSSWVIPHVDRILKGLENRTEAFLKEAHCIREALEASAIVDGNSSSTIIDAFLFDVDTEVREINDERIRLFTELAGVRTTVGLGSADRITSAQRLLEQAVLERGSDRGLLLREVKNLLVEVSNNEAVVHPIIWLIQGWATWQLTDNPQEAVPLLTKVSQHPVPSMAASLAFRILSYFAQMDEQPAKALECAGKAVEIRTHAETCLDAALCAAGLHDPSTAKSNFEAALVDRASALMGALCDDRALQYGSELIEVAVRVQMRMRREGRQAVSAWAASARQVGEAQKICTGGLHIPYELMEGHKQILDRLVGADLISGGYLMRSSRENAAEVLDYARKNLQAEHVKRCDAVSMARKSIEGASVIRDNRIEAALRQQDDVKRRAESALSASDEEAEKSEKGSVFGFASGCVMFALYMVSYLILADRGIAIGVGTPVGIGAVVMAAMPIVVAVGIQIRQGLRRFALEARCNEVLKRASVTYDEASQDADDAYREQMKHHRKVLAHADSELRKVESAMRYLGLNRSSVDGPVEEEESVPELEPAGSPGMEPEAEVEFLTEAESELDEFEEAEAPAA